MNEEEDVGSPAVLDAHLTAAGVNVSVGRTNGFGGLPANLPAVVGGLAVFVCRLDHSLPEKTENSKEKFENFTFGAILHGVARRKNLKFDDFSVSAHQGHRG